MMESFMDTTIRDGRDYLNQQIRRGKATKCPCCTQLVKVYSRKIYSTMARNLIELYKLDRMKHDYYHIGEIATGQTSGGGDFAKLTYWGLVTEMPKDKSKTNQRTSGYWMITEEGRKFVMNQLKVPEYVDIYDGRPLKFRGEPTAIVKSLGKSFDYEELMG